MRLATRWILSGVALFVLGLLALLYARLPSVARAQTYNGICATAADIDTLLPGQWCRSNSNTIYDVRPNPSPTNTMGGSYTTNAAVMAWSSGAYDTSRDRLLVMGGGHGDYSGNEVYAFSLATMSWSRIWGPTPNAQIAISVEAYLDGSPSSRHTYDAVEYLPTQDALWLEGGSIFGNGNAGQDTWMFSLSNSTWTKKANPPSFTPLSVTSDYDSVTGNMFTTPGYGMYVFNPSANTWSTPNPDNPIPNGMTGAIDPIRRKLVLVGNGSVFSYDLATGARQTLSTTGDTGVVNALYPGLEYDPVADSIVAWGGYGDSGAYVVDVHALDLDTLVWTRHAPAPSNLTTPSTPAGTGTFGRWRYIPSKNAFMVVNAVNEPVYFYKFSAGDGSPPADTTPPTILNIQSTPSSAGATVTWNTNESSDSQVEYGTTTAYGNSTTLNITAVTSHSVAITGLSAGTVYHYRVKSRDAAGNLGTSTDATFTTSVTTPTPGQIDIPLDTWVGVPLPIPPPHASACDGGACKHIRVAYNSNNGRTYWFGGDHNNGPDHSQSGSPEMWSYSVLGNDWRLETSFCVPAGQVQPSYPDEVGFAFDSLRNQFWHYPGFQYAPNPSQCGGTEVYHKPMSFSVPTQTWSDPNLSWDAWGVRFSQYDPVGDRTLSFEYDGSSVVEHNLGTGIIRRVNTIIPPGEDGGSVFVAGAYTALDLEGRQLYAADFSRRKLYRYDLDTNEFRFMSTLPISSCLPESYCTPEQMLFWDANNDVLLWPYRAPTLDSGYPDEQIRLFAYHPDTNQWEERTVTAPRNMQGGALLDGNGDPYRVIGRNGTFDPVQNVMVITGSGAEVGSVPYLYLYRYGDGSGTPPTPDTTAPAAVTNLTAF